MVETTELERDVLETPDSELESMETLTHEDLARPALTIKEASSLLGRSVRALERSILGRWGNKLPEGWIAKKISIDGKDEWRIIPPESFRVRHRTKEDVEATNDTEGDEELIPNLLEEALNLPSRQKENFILKRSGGDDSLDNSTIIIDRSEEVETLLKELVMVHKALAEETRQHVEDLKILNEMTNSMRLLENNQRQTLTLKEELLGAQKEMLTFRKQYEEYLNLPWWKRVFRSFP